jgi:hypothetical protein
VPATPDPRTSPASPICPLGHEPNDQRVVDDAADRRLDPEDASPDNRQLPHLPLGDQTAKRTSACPSPANRREGRKLAPDDASDWRWAMSTHDNPMSRFHARSVGRLDATYMS